MTRGTAAALLFATLALAGCGGDDDTAAPVTTGETTTLVTTTEAAPPAGQLNDQYGQRYCEVLTIQLGAEGTTAEVWGTQGLNDCPQAGFDRIDPQRVAAELGVTVALPNGPRYWVLDQIVANELAGSGETARFGGIQMRSIALVELGAGLPDREPLTETSVERDTEFVFDAGRDVYELTSADGSVYVMQSYSVEIDPTLTTEDLAGLGDRLRLPAGWTFTSRVLEEPLVVEDIDGVATVIQDELRNSYQLLRRG